MKYNKLNLLFVCICCLLYSHFAAFSQSPVYMYSAPEGFGAGTTGGGTPDASNTVTVTTSTELSDALSGTKSVILVSGVITTTRLDKVFSNKTILGLPGATLISIDSTSSGSGILNIKAGSTNIIIRNLIFVGPGAYDVDGWDLLTVKGTTKLWVDHCEFRDGLDDSFDFTNNSDNATVSWCKFRHVRPAIPVNLTGFTNDHRYSNLIGGSDTDAPTDGHYSMTWQNCWWGDGNKDRMVRARNGELHFINCYWSSKVASNNISLTAGSNGTTCYVENSYFDCAGNKIRLDKTGSMSAKAVNCTTPSGVAPTIYLSNSAVNLEDVTAPSYTATIFPVEQVVSALTNSTCGAGATLNISSDGQISLGDCSTGISSFKKSELRIFPSLVEASMNVEVPKEISGDTKFSIFQINGKMVKEIEQKTNLGETISINVQSLKHGFYLLKVSSKNTIYTAKFIKK